MSRVQPITSLEHFKELILSPRVSVIDFWAEWCGPCKMMTPLFKKFADLDEFKNVDFYTCDTEELEVVMMECSVKAMPSFMAFQSGFKVKEVLGVQPQQLQALLKDAALLSDKALAEGAVAPAPVEPTKVVTPTATPAAAPEPTKPENPVATEPTKTEPSKTEPTKTEAPAPAVEVPAAKV